MSMLRILQIPGFNFLSLMGKESLVESKVMIGGASGVIWGKIPSHVHVVAIAY